MTDTQITLIGTMVADPELRFTPAGQAVANFRIASTPRKKNTATGEWEDGETLFLSCSVWRQYAENVAESLRKGMQVIVQGRLKSRSYEDREGQKRTVFEVEVEEVGPALRFATATVTRAPSSGSRGGSSSASRPAQQQGDPWATQPAGDPWATQPAAQEAPF